MTSSKSRGRTTANGSRLAASNRPGGAPNVNEYYHSSGAGFRVQLLEVWGFMLGTARMTPPPGGLPPRRYTESSRQ
jgi:hypothetical protein